jgi:hypothetical protein
VLRLPDVTLVMVETREHALARMAIADCVAAADFGGLVIITDRPSEFSEFSSLKPQFKIVPDWPSKLGWSRSWWFDVPPLLRTSHSLNIQWDSWIWLQEMWSDDFLKYDYIGSPWWYKDGKNVGNGGFCLVSTRLKRYIADRRWEYPCNVSVDDDLLCRRYRPSLEEKGFRWASEEVAHRFAFECSRPSADSKHFGFHAMFNWPVVLDRDRLIERMELATRSPYIKDSYMMQAFCQKHPQIVAELAAGAAVNEEQDKWLRSVLI